MDYLYLRLRERIKEQGLTFAYLQLLIGQARKSNFLSDRMVGKRRFDVETAYKIMEVLHVPREEFAHYFPPNGVEVAGAKSPAAPPEPAAPRKYLILEVLEGDASILTGGVLNG